MTKRLKETKNKESEKIFNLPNFLTISRIILTFIIVYFIISGAGLDLTITIFVIAALTDFFDGQIARRFKMVTEFGRKADMIADRFLWIGTAFSFFIVYAFKGNLDGFHALQLLLIMTREVISMPFAIVGFFSGREIPSARYIAKVTTFLQGFALPALILSVHYTFWTYISGPLAIIIAITGAVSAGYYIKDISSMKKKR